MLIIDLKPNIPVKIGDTITVTLLTVRGRKAKVAFDAPPEIKILREDAVKKS